MVQTGIGIDPSQSLRQDWNLGQLKHNFIDQPRIIDINYQRIKSNFVGSPKKSQLHLSNTNNTSTVESKNA